MQTVARFEKVSKEQFEKDVSANGFEACYEDILLPKRATVGSAGYDFYAPFDITIKPGEEVTIPTGVRAEIAEGWVLMCCPRSGLGFRFRLQLNNTVGIIDSDYYHAANEGHIMARLFNDSRSDKTVQISKGDGFIQGLFLPFGITQDDEVTAIREGGFGSTTKK